MKRLESGVMAEKTETKKVLESLRIYVPLSIIRNFTLKVKLKPEKYKKLDERIKGARLPTTLQRYLAITSFYSNLSFLFGFVITLLYLYLFKIDLAGALYKAGNKVIGTLASFMGQNLLLTKLSSYLYLLTIEKYKIYLLIAAALLVALILRTVFKYFILSYPSLIIKNRVYEIDLYLPHAVNMMYGMATGGSPAYEIIKKVAEARGLFGELSKEFAIIVEMVEIFKKDMLSAIRYVRDTTPSKKLASFLDNFIFILRGGGKLSEFLKNKSQEYLEEQEISFENYVGVMGMLSEIYLALFVMLPLFMLIVLVVLGMTGQDVLSLYRNILLFMLPPLAGLFIFLIKSVVSFPTVKLEKFEERFKGPKVRTSEAITQSYRIDKFKNWMKKTKRFLLHPFRVPVYNIQLRVLAFHLAVVSTASFLILVRFLRFETTLVIAVSVFLVPLILVNELRERSIRKIESNIPSVFAELAMLNEAGLTVQEGLRVLATTTEMGILTREVNVLEREIRWGILIPSAFIRLGLRIKSELLARIIPVIVRTFETAATVKDAFYTVAKYAESEIRFKDRLRKSMLVYVLIVYICIGVFLFTTYVVVNNFFSISAHMKALATQAIGTLKLYIDIKFIKEIFLQVTLIVSIVSGIIAGVIESGKISAGLKHSYAFLILTYLLFFHLL